MFGIFKKDNNELSTNDNNNYYNDVPSTGTFEEGVDGRGNPYQKKNYDNGNYQKDEILHDGTKKRTLKWK